MAPVAVPRAGCGPAWGCALLARIAPLVLAGALQAAAAQTNYPGPGVPQELAQQRFLLIEDLRYELFLSIPAGTNAPITGTNDIRFRLRGRPQPLVLDFSPTGLPDLSIVINDRAAQIDPVNGHWVIPAAYLRSGQNTIRTRFTAGDAPLNRHADFLYSLFVPARAHEAFPCFDQPDLKARWTLALEHPAKWKSSANAASREVQTKAGRTRVRFAQTAPLPTYLVAFVAGDFRVETARRGARTLQMFHRETDDAKLARNREAIFDLHAHALEAMERYTGIPYPFGKFDFVLIPAFQYGGMEHPGNVLYNAEHLLLDESATQDDQLERASTIAHETAHMWFGDLVTMRWFDDVWCKEVFANFFAAKLVHPMFPQIDHDLHFLLANHRNAYRVDRTDGANPIRQPLDNLAQAAQLYGPIIYNKAPVVMRQIEAIMGESAFRDGLRAYLRTYSYSNATWDDLVAILGTRTPSDLRALSRAWIDAPGRPTITTDRDEQQARIVRLVLRQTDPQGLGRLWPQQLRVTLACASGRKQITVVLREAAVDLLPLLEGCEPQYILAAGAGWGYGDFVLDPASMRALTAGFSSIDDALTRGSAWLTLVDAMLDARMAPEQLFEVLLAALPRENDEDLAQAMLSDLPVIWWRFFTPAMRAERAQRLESGLREALERAVSTSAKAALFRALRAVAITPETVEWLAALWAHEGVIAGLPLAEADDMALAQELALRQPAHAQAVLQEQLARIGNPDRRARFAFVMPALSSDQARRSEWFQALRQPDARRREAWVVEGLRWLHHPLRAQESATLVRPALDMLVDIQRTGDIFFASDWLRAVLGGHSAAQEAHTVRAFLAEQSPDYPPRLRQLILQNADILFRAARSLETPGRTALPAGPSEKRLDAGLRPAQNEGMDVMGALVGVHDLQIDHVPRDPELIVNAIAPEHVARLARDIERLAAGIALHQGGDFHGGGAVILHPPQAQATLQCQADLGLHVGKFFLHQLIGRQGTPELASIQGVLPGDMPARLGSAQRAPGDAKARRIQAGEGTLQSIGMRQFLIRRHEHIVHDDFPGDRCAQPDFPVYGRRAEPGAALVQKESANASRIVLGPDHKHIGDRRIGNPGLGAAQAVAPGHRTGARDHAARVGAVIGFGQTKAADRRSSRQVRQVLASLRLGTKLHDR